LRWIFKPYRKHHREEKMIQLNSHKPRHFGQGQGQVVDSKEHFSRVSRIFWGFNSGPCRRIQQANLVASTGRRASIVDPTLINAWGIAIRRTWDGYQPKIV
jgi:hypothetical protein